MTRYHKGDKVTATRKIDDMDVPTVPEGTPGTVVTTTLLGKPKRVSFAVFDGWGTKHFRATVRPGDVERVRSTDL